MVSIKLKSACDYFSAMVASAISASQSRFLLLVCPNYLLNHPVSFRVPWKVHEVPTTSSKWKSGNRQSRELAAGRGESLD